VTFGSTLVKAVTALVSDYAFFDRLMHLLLLCSTGDQVTP